MVSRWWTSTCWPWWHWKPEFDGECFSILVVSNDWGQLSGVALGGVCKSVVEVVVWLVGGGSRLVPFLTSSSFLGCGQRDGRMHLVQSYPHPHHARSVAALWLAVSLVVSPCTPYSVLYGVVANDLLFPHSSWLGDRSPCRLTRMMTSAQ